MQNDETKSVNVMSLMTLIIGAIAPMLDSTMTNVAIKTIMTDLHASVGTIQWVTTSYVLAMGIMVLIISWAADHFSGKLLYITGTVVFLIGSIIAGFANDTTLLIIGRIIQGAGSGIIFPLISTLAVRAAHGQNLGKLMAIMGLPMVLGPILGPTIGGFIVDRFNWHWIFYVNIPVAIISLILLAILMEQFPAVATGKKFDFIGFALLATMFITMIVGIVNLSKNADLTAANFLYPVALGIVLLLAYIAYAFKMGNRALISLRLFAYKNFSGSTLILLMSGITINGAMFLLPLYLQNVRGLSVVWSGIYLIAQGLGLLVSRTQIGKLTDSLGARKVVLVSLVIAVASTTPFIFFDASTSNIWILIALFFRGIGQGGFTLPVMADSFVGIPADLVSEATTGTRTMQNVGGAFGTAILATVISSSLGTTIPTVARLTTAYHTAFIWSVACTAVAVLPAMWLTNKAK